MTIQVSSCFADTWPTSGPIPQGTPSLHVSYLMYQGHWTVKKGSSRPGLAQLGLILRGKGGGVQLSEQRPWGSFTSQLCTFRIPVQVLLSQLHPDVCARARVRASTKTLLILCGLRLTTQHEGRACRRSGQRIQTQIRTL